MTSLSNAKRVLLCLAIVSLSCAGFPASDRLPSVAAAGEPTPGALAFPLDRSNVVQALRQLETGLPPAEVHYLAKVIVEESDRWNVSPALVLGVIAVESSGRIRAVSHVGARGLMQLLPGTGADVARRLGVAWDGPATLFVPDANVTLGIAYLAELIERYDSLEVALAAYNWGPTRISARIRKGQRVPAYYARRVMDEFRLAGRAV